MAVIHHRHLELGVVGFVDVFLIDLDVHLAHRAGGDDHVGVVVVGGLDDVFDLRLAFFRFGKRQRTAAAGDLLLVFVGRLGAHGFDHFVEVFGVLEGFAVYAERAVGLTADIAGDFQAFEGFFHRCRQRIVAEILDQHFHHMAHAGGGFFIDVDLQSGVREDVLSVRQQLLGFGQALHRLLGPQPAGGAGGHYVLAFVVLLGQGDVARVHHVARQLAAVGVADGCAAAVPIGDLVQLDVQSPAHGVHRHHVVGRRGLALRRAARIKGVFFFRHSITLRAKQALCVCLQFGMPCAAFFANHFCPRCRRPGTGRRD